MGRELHGCNAGHIGSSVTGSTGSGVRAVSRRSNDFSFTIPYKDFVLSLNPVAYWRLDETSGTTAVDETGNHDGTYEGSPALDQSPIVLSGSAVGFDGTDDRVTTGWSGLTSGMVTLAVWVRSTTTTENADVFIAWGDTPNDGEKVHFRFNTTTDGKYGALRVENQGGNVIGSTVINDGNPHFCVAVINLDGDVNETVLYADGNEEITSDANAQLFNVAIGNNLTLAYRNQDGTGYYFSGTLDEPVIWDRALTTQEIADLYNAGT